MREQVAESNFSRIVRSGASGKELWEQVAQEGIQIEQSALLEKHRSRRSSNYFCYACQIVDGFGGDARRIRLISKVAQGAYVA